MTKKPTKLPPIIVLTSSGFILIATLLIWLETQGRLDLGLMPELILLVAGSSLISFILSIFVCRQALKQPQNSHKTDCQNQSEALVGSIGEGIIVVNQDLKISLINPEAQNILGWKDDALGLSVHSVLRLVDARGQVIDDVNNPIIQAQQKGEIKETSELFIKTLQDQQIPIRLKINPAKQNFIIAFSDISKDIAKNQAQLEFISTASHEMRTPVAAIDGYLSLMLNPKICQLDAKAFEYASKAQASSKHLGELFKNLLDISKLEDNRMNINLEVVDIKQLLAQLCQNLAPVAEQKNLKLLFLAPLSEQKNSPKILPSFYAHVDYSLLTAALSNLIENAIKYTPNGQISLDLVAEGQDKLLISVEDTGIGIPDNDIKHLFEKFYRVDNSDTREIGGTGLGLYLTKKIVEELKGKIWVESKLGEGSKFFIALNRLSSQQIAKIRQTQSTKPQELSWNTKTLNQSQLDKAQNPAANQTNDSSATPALETNAPSQSSLDTPSEVTVPVDSKVISSASAERLKALGYNTDNYTIR